MAGVKRNLYLDAGSDKDGESENLYDSEGLEDLRQSRTSHLHPRTAKRLKFSRSASESDENDESDGAQRLNGKVSLFPKQARDQEPVQHDSPTVVAEEAQTAHLGKEDQTLKKPKEKVRKRKTGVVYLSRIPPFMKPPTVRQLLTPYGIITKLFLTPEPQAHYLARKKNHGNKKRSFLDGWVEFASKKHAKACAETINGELVGGKKGGWYHDDIWNAKYLKGFKWDDLMEGVRSEERAREERMRVEIRRETRERKAFLENVEQSKKERGMEKKRAEKKQGLRPDIAKPPASTEPDMRDDNSQEDEERRPKKTHERRFKQSEVMTVANKPTGEQPDEVRRVLNKIF